ncbi:glycine dehydrogenase [Croceiramulus getboli]|nr:glycine dehydrogenase [Flavobacteriaceae bacterium YJPT1-3]
MKEQEKIHPGKHLCDKNQYGDTTFWEKIKLAFYLVFSAECRAYTRKNTQLTKTIHRAEMNTIAAEEKIKLQSLLDQELANQQ